MRYALLLCVLLVSANQAHADGRSDKRKPAPPAREDPSAPQPPKPNECAKVEGSARWVGMGYTHVVTLRSECPRAVVCTVWTDADPEPRQTVAASPGESVEVVTRRGSPAREVQASKDCSFR